ncbi:arylesterase [Methyloceanibacter sp.]|jgi:acyl-CoA thioesterase-1|uniref:arylesterase n=1 Tax=Methyloceanibacter sp. TaxID=1965321 RepID=UPI002B58370D|nr:arylesterase [Methyloceanibacter sp.]
MKSAAAWVALVVASLPLFVAVSPVAQAEPHAPVIVTLGDSLTAGLGLPQSEAFPAQLQAVLKARGRDVTVIDAGVSGDTATAAAQRLDWALPDNADAVIVELGGNDALQGVPPEGTKAAIEKIIVSVQARGLPILLAGQEAPRNMGKEYVEAFSAIFRDLAERYDVIFYPFFLEGAALNAELMQPDGMHPNAKGVARIVENILPKVEELLARVAAKG